jgi:hypothetical protein
MKSKATLILSAALAVLALVPAAAADKKISKPRSNEVVLVARIIVSPAIDREFYSHYVYANMVPIYKAFKGKLPDDQVFLETNTPGKSDDAAEQNLVGDLGDVGFAKVAIPKKREIQIDGSKVQIVGNAYLSFYLPLNRKIIVPEGVNYVYLGTFTYSVKDEFFNVSDISRSDEFDAAAIAVEKAFGKDAQLTRANLLALEDPTKKK